MRDELAAHGAIAVDERVVVSGRIVTSAGVSAGIDMALRLAALLAGDEVARRIALTLEYAPEPPFGPRPGRRTAPTPSSSPACARATRARAPESRLRGT